MQSFLDYKPLFSHHISVIVLCISLFKKTVFRISDFFTDTFQEEEEEVSLLDLDEDNESELGDLDFFNDSTSSETTIYYPSDASEEERGGEPQDSEENPPPPPRRHTVARRYLDFSNLPPFTGNIIPSMYDIED